MSQGQINVYTCQTCHQRLVTVDRDDGVTPMFLGCTSGNRCEYPMISAGYQCDQTEPPTHEWYRPSLKNARRRGPSMLEHVKLGGLDIRPIKPVPA